MAGPASQCTAKPVKALAALTAERDRLRDLHPGSEPSRLGVEPGDVGGAGRSGSEDGAGSGRRGGGRGLDRAAGLRAVPQPGQAFTCGGSPSPPCTCSSLSPRRSLRLSYLEAPHLLSVSSDTTADSSAPLNPGRRWGAKWAVGPSFLCRSLAGLARPETQALSQQNTGSSHIRIISLTV